MIATRRLGWLGIFIQHLVDFLRNRHFQSQLLGQIMRHEGCIDALRYLVHRFQNLRQRASLGKFYAYVVIAA